MIDSEHGTTSVWVRSLNSTWWSLKRMQDRSWQKKMILHFLDVMIHAKQWGGHALHYRSVSIPRTFNFKSLHRRTNLGTERTHMCTLYFFHSWTVSVARCWWQMEHSLFWRNTSGDIAGKTIPNCWCFHERGEEDVESCPWGQKCWTCLQRHTKPCYNIITKISR